MKRWLMPVLVALVTLLIISGIAFAIDKWFINCTIDIQPGTGIKVYSDLALTQEMSTINFGQFKRGETVKVPCYIVNTTNSKIRVTAAATENISIRGELYFEPTEGLVVDPAVGFTLTPGTHSSGWLGFKARIDGLLGIKTFSVAINAEVVP